MTNIGFPYAFDGRGRTGTVPDDSHIEQMIQQVLFTMPGERVNQPTFGSGLLQLTFAPNSPEVAAALQFVCQGSLQQWLGDLIEVSSLNVESTDSTLSVTIVYQNRATQQSNTVTFTQGVP